jgi:hypothetical protein
MPRTSIVVLSLGSTSAALAANIAPNPGFDAEVSGWSEVLGTELEWFRRDKTCPIRVYMRV